MKRERRDRAVVAGESPRSLVVAWGQMDREVGRSGGQEVAARRERHGRHGATVRRQRATAELRHRAFEAADDDRLAMGCDLACVVEMLFRDVGAIPIEPPAPGCPKAFSLGESGMKSLRSMYPSP